VTVATLRRLNQPPVQAAVKNVGLVTRVSTDRQAATEEGSLKNQIQRLRAHVEYKNVACGEDWTEVAVYELKAVSGKDSLRSEEFQRLFADMAAGRINAVACTALDRISRSVADFLRFFEILNEHGVEFVCLKQNYDTTSPQGKLFITIMMALAQFEREQTAERTRDATAARADRGLWNGGRLLGYDLDAERKGYLVPNRDEVALVNFAFETYLKTGSIIATRDALNARGYRTKAFTSRRNQHHPGKPFAMASVQYLLKNPAYLAKKEINKPPRMRAKGYRLVDAVWPAIVDVDVFEAARRLMAANGRSNHNGSAPTRHTYVLSQGLLHCGRCKSAMQGRSGNGRGGVKYFYYACANRTCTLRVTAGEIEGAVLDRIAQLASDDSMLAAIVEQTNRTMAKEIPALRQRKRAIERKLVGVRSMADKVVSEWSSMDAADGRAFLSEKLSELSREREELEAAMTEVDIAIGRTDTDAVSAQMVADALTDMGSVYEHLKPFERKELLRLVLHRADVSEREIVLEINGSVCGLAGRKRFEAPNWLPGLDSNQQPCG
jgi:site-specific DNA recombinase